MSDSKQRVQFMQSLVAGSPVSGTPKHSDIQAEFDEVLLVRRVLRKPRKRLLQVLHSTRALDSTLKEFINLHGCSSSPSSLGQYLYALRNGDCPPLGQICEHERLHYQTEIVDLRNTYMHEAGLMPTNDSEILTLLGEMQSCLQRVLSL